jgi:hypothetical protein
MLNLFNNNNNFSLFDHDLLNYGLLLGSVSLIGFTIYYFTGYFNKNIVDTGTHTLPNAETMTQRIINNLENQPITDSDTLVPKLDTLVEASLNKVNASVQTISHNLDANIQTLPILTDNFAQTSDKHLADKIQEILYGMCSEGEDLSNIDPVTFSNEIRNNPQYSGWFNSIQDWANNIKTNSGKSFNPSEINFLQRLRDELNSTINSPVVEIQNESTINLITQNNNILILIQRKIEYLHNVTVNIDDLSKILYYYTSVLQESNLNEYVVYCTQMCNSQIFPTI